jgi:Protein of unknown function (DUF1559)
MVQIKKLDRQVSTTGPEESQKSESSVISKPKSSKGIAESESKFETAKPNSLFQSSAYSTVRSAEKKSENLVRNLNTESHSNSSSSTTSITDGTSNTIVVGEQNTASRPEASTTPASQDQTAGTPVFSNRDDTTTRNRQAPVVVIGVADTNVQSSSGVAALGQSYLKDKALNHRRIHPVVNKQTLLPLPMAVLTPSSLESRAPKQHQKHLPIRQIKISKLMKALQLPQQKLRTVHRIQSP